MIDVENEVYTKVANAVREQYAGAYVTSTYVDAPPAFPCVTVMEIANVPMRRTRDSAHIENHAVVGYEVDVYSNLTDGKKAQCKAIAKLVNDTMAGMNFTRKLFTPMPNLADGNIYRITARYEAVVGSDGKVYYG